MVFSENREKFIDCILRKMIIHALPLCLLQPLKFWTSSCWLHVLMGLLLLRLQLLFVGGMAGGCGYGFLTVPYLAELPST